MFEWLAACAGIVAVVAIGLAVVCMPWKAAGKVLPELWCAREQIRVEDSTELQMDLMERRERSGDLVAVHTLDNAPRELPSVWQVD